jgi:hypothetical protein
MLQRKQDKTRLAVPHSRDLLEPLAKQSLAVSRVLGSNPDEEVADIRHELGLQQLGNGLQVPAEFIDHLTVWLSRLTCMISVSLSLTACPSPCSSRFWPLRIKSVGNK